MALERSKRLRGKSSAREKLFGAETKCESEKCLFDGVVRAGEDAIVVWTNRGKFPFSLSDLVNLDGRFEVFHTDCAFAMGESNETEIVIDDTTKTDKEEEKSNG